MPLELMKTRVVAFICPEEIFQSISKGRSSTAGPWLLRPATVVAQKIQADHVLAVLPSLWLTVARLTGAVHLLDTATWFCTLLLCFLTDGSVFSDKLRLVGVLVSCQMLCFARIASHADKSTVKAPSGRYRASSVLGQQQAVDDATAPSHCKGFDEMSDEELVSYLESVVSISGNGLNLPSVTTIHLRISDADLEDLPPNARKSLMKGVESKYPGLKVVGCAFNKGSILVGLNVALREDGGGCVEYHSLAADPPVQWLEWMGLPMSMVLGLKVGSTPDPRADFLEASPLAVVAFSKALDLECGKVPPDVILHAHYRDVKVDVFSDDGKRLDSGSSQPAGVLWPDTDGTVDDYIGVTLNDSPEADTIPCGLLVVEARCAITKIVFAATPILVVPPKHKDVADELSSDTSTKLAVPKGSMPTPRALVGSLGWWVQMVSTDMYKSGDISECDRQLARKIGFNLLWILVVQGRVASATMVKQLLLSSGTSAGLHDLCAGSHPEKRTLLHLAMLSSSRPMLEAVFSWCPEHGQSIAWKAKDVGSLTPLHLIAMNDEQKLLPWLLSTYPEAKDAWVDDGGIRGFSPEKLAQRVAKYAGPQPSDTRTRYVCKSATMVQAQERKSIELTAAGAAGAGTSGAAAPGPPASVQVPGQPYRRSATQSRRELRLKTLLWGFKGTSEELMYLAFKASRLPMLLQVWCGLMLSTLAICIVKGFAGGLAGVAPAVMYAFLYTAMALSLKWSYHWTDFLLAVGWGIHLSCLPMIALRWVPSPMQERHSMFLAALAVQIHVESCMFVKTRLVAVLLGVFLLSYSSYALSVHGHGLWPATLTVTCCICVMVSSLLLHLAVDYSNRVAFLKARTVTSTVAKAHLSGATHLETIEE